MSYNGANGFGGHHGHHGGHHGGYYPYPMMIPQYQPSTIEVITTGDDICTACRAKTVTGPACSKCGVAGYGADVGWGTAAGSLIAVGALAAVVWYLSKGKPRRRRRVVRRRRRRYTRRRAVSRRADAY